MNKIEKFLAKLNFDRREMAKELIHRIVSGNLQNLDVKKLKGNEAIFRVRSGRIRILFVKKDIGYGIIDVDNRDDNTYN
jgi:mRNA-degrading endonuclease RelE of RelBE toxin-antitoxin system